jgi:putative membrane protein
MQPGTKKFLHFLKSWAINTLAVALTVLILRGHISYEDKPENLLLASLLLGILNAFVRPILMLIALPLLIFTLGLFMLVINALLLTLLTILLPFFHITRDGVHSSFGYAFLGAFLISVISIVLNIMTGNARANIKIQRRPPPKKTDDDDKPVIDV